MSAKATTEIDQRIADRMRMARMAKRVTQQQLAEAIGISFQQVQKYEKGANRISAARLAMVAQALDCDIAWFFEGAANGASPPSLGLKDVESIEALKLLGRDAREAIDHLVHVIAEGHAASNVAMKGKI